jgi:preprotein translocase subunit SecA
MAQRDPLIEYQREGYDMFSRMMEGIKEEAVGYLFNVQVAPVEETTRPGVGIEPSSAAEPASGAEPITEPVATAPADQRARRAGAPTADHNGDTQVPAALRGAGVGRPADTATLSYSGPDEDGSERRSIGRRAPVGNGGPEPARNQPCPCGSGRKYKHCHGARTGARG